MTDDALKYVKPIKDVSVYTYFSIVVRPKMQLTKLDVEKLQSLEGYIDPSGALYWEGKTLEEYLTARISDKIKQLQSI